MLLCDVDGVLAEFVHPLTRHVKEWPKGVYDIESVTGLSRAEVWSHPEVNTVEFWAELPKTRFADEVMEAILERFPKDEVCFLTKPTINPKCAQGKMHWIRKHFPGFFFLIGSSKKFCAAEGKVLVDDYEENVIEFEAHGGYGILFPRDWNALHHVEDPVAHLREKLL